MPTERPPLLGEVVPTFADRGCCVVSATNPPGRILGFLDRSRYYFFQVQNLARIRRAVETYRELADSVAHHPVQLSQLFLIVSDRGTVNGRRSGGGSPGETAGHVGTSRAPGCEEFGGGILDELTNQLTCYTTP
jgi:hypothetical protein